MALKIFIVGMLIRRIRARGVGISGLLPAEWPDILIHTPANLNYVGMWMFYAFFICRIAVVNLGIKTFQVFIASCRAESREISPEMLISDELCTRNKLFRKYVVLIKLLCIFFLSIKIRLFVIFFYCWNFLRY